MGVERRGELTTVTTDLQGLIFFVNHILLFKYLQLQIDVTQDNGTIFKIVRGDRGLNKHRFRKTRHLRSLTIFFLLFLLFRLPSFNLPFNNLLPNFFRFLVRLISFIRTEAPFL